MDDSSWIKVMKDADLRERTMAPVFPKGLPVLLVRLPGGGLRALANKCAHMGCPLSRGTLNGELLTCPCHDWTFDVRGGEFVSAPEIRLGLYECRVSDGSIFVRIPS